MAESAEELYARAADALHVPDFTTWGTFPFEGDIRVRALIPPADERPRRGAGGVECWLCDAADDAFIWTDANWRISVPQEPSGFPVVVFLNSRAHYADPGDLPDDLAASFGVVLARLERAVRSVGEIGRVHISRWGDGGEHLHWWVYGRPALMLQFQGTFAALWEDLLPRYPEALWKENLAKIARAMSAP